MQAYAWSIPLALILVMPVVAQEKELALMEQVSELQRQLESAVVTERAEAERQLLELGVPVLEYLEPVAEPSSTDYVERITRIRTTLEKRAVNSVTQPSVVSLTGAMTLGEALSRIKRQTGNDIAVADQALSGIGLQLDLQQVEFWPALQQILSQAKLDIDQYGSRPSGQMTLAPVDPSSRSNPMVSASSRIFQVTVTRVGSSINLVNRLGDFTAVNLRVRWEPRFRPIAVDLPLRDVSVIDEFGDTLPLSNRNRIIYGRVQPEIPEVEFALQLPRIDRQIENIRRIKATLDAVLPGRVESFRFENISRTRAGQQIQRAGATVTFDGLQENEGLYAVQIGLGFDEENSALESHRGWVFDNKVVLINRLRQREEPVSLETVRQDNQQVIVRYYFLNDPGDRTLEYRTPANIVRVPFEIELTDIPLP